MAITNEAKVHKTAEAATCVATGVSARTIAARASREDGLPHPCPPCCGSEASYEEFRAGGGREGGAGAQKPVRVSDGLLESDGHSYAPMTTTACHKEKPTRAKLP